MYNCIVFSILVQSLAMIHMRQNRSYSLEGEQCSYYKKIIWTYFTCNIYIVMANGQFCSSVVCKFLD